MELDEEGKELVQELGAAINEAVEKSTRVLKAIEQLHESGYFLDLTIRLEIALRREQKKDEKRKKEIVRLDLTAEDLRTLRQMKIRIDEDM